MDNNQFGRLPVMAVKTNKGGKLTLVLAILVLIIAVVGLLHFSGAIDLVSMFKEKSDKEVKETENVNEGNAISEEEQELINVCMLVDANGDYQYNEYHKHIMEETAKLEKEPTEEEFYEIMSGMSFCTSNECSLIEKDGTVNYRNCETGEFVRLPYDEFTEYIEEVIKVNIKLHTACSNLDVNGDFSSKDEYSTMECDDYLCKLNYSGKEHVRNCKSN